MKRQKVVATLTLILFLSVIFGLGAGVWLIPQKSFSENENRVLQALPRLSLQALTDGELSEDFNAYYADHLPLRRALLSVNATAALALGRGESNGVLVGRGGQLAVRKFDAYISLTERARDTDYFDPHHVTRGVEALGRLARAVDLPLTLLPAPRTVDVVTAAASFAYPAALSDDLRLTLMQAADREGVDTLDLTPAFRAAYDGGEYVYFRTDHHWTTLGAYVAYTALMTHWGMGDEILPAETFTVRRVEDFYGTTWSRAGLFSIPPDTLEIWRLPDNETYALRDKDGGLIQYGFIDEKYLDTKDKYGAFLSGTRQILTVTQEGDDTPDKPRLLIARDSFASALAPLLARHFDLVLVNLSGAMTHLSAYAQEYACDRILVVCNLENVVTSDCLLRVE